MEMVDKATRVVELAKEILRISEPPREALSGEFYAAQSALASAGYELATIVLRSVEVDPVKQHELQGREHAAWIDAMAEMRKLGLEPNDERCDPLVAAFRKWGEELHHLRLGDPSYDEAALLLARATYPDGQWERGTYPEHSGEEGSAQ